MKQPVLILSILLVLWISGAAYWYVCKIRIDCRDAAVTAVETEAADDTLASNHETMLAASVEEARQYLDSTGIQKGFFASSSAEGDLSSISDEYVKKLKLYLDNNPSARAQVTGHADITGPDPFNFELGLKRAGFAKAFLVNAGIKADQVVTSTKGSSEPAASNSTPEGRAANRRIEIKVII